MAKTYLMGDGKMTPEQRAEYEKHKAEREAQEREWTKQQLERQKKQIEVTLSELLETTLEPMEDRIIVWRDKVQVVTDTGIIKPEEVIQNERPQKGTVIAVGPGKDNSNLTNELLLAILEETHIANSTAAAIPDGIDDLRKRVEMTHIPYQPGDRIMFGKYAGTPVEDPKTGEELLIMRPADIFVKF